MSKYVIKRSDVCAGQLIRTGRMSLRFVDSKGDELSLEELREKGIKNFSCSGGIICRGMLFNVDDNLFANDLIYDTPGKYPIENVTPKDIPANNGLFIDEYVELDELLKYMKYGVDLTQADLLQVYKKLITHDSWLRHHMEVFGWKKLDNGCYSSGGEQIVPINVYHSLQHISCIKRGKPHKEEPGYSYIKKK